MVSIFQKSVSFEFLAFLLLGFLALIAISGINANPVEYQLLNSGEHNSDDDGLFSLDKKSLDKYKYFGGLGKRMIEHEDNAIIERDVDDDVAEEKRFDKMKYYGGLGKKSYQNYKINERQLNDLIKKSKGGIDRLRYMGNIGK